MALGHVDDDFGGELAHSFLTELLAKAFENRRHDARFDLTALEHTNIVQRICTFFGHAANLGELLGTQETTGTRGLETLTTR